MEQQQMMEIQDQNKSIVSQDGHAIFKKSNRPVTLKFVDVLYDIKVKDEGIFNVKKKTTDKRILNGISGVVYPGEMLAMLGPSGSGKTTLLTALGGRGGNGTLGGSITYNGKPFSNALKRNTGFVTQDDVLYPHLTVMETLVYTALLRLPNSFTKADKVNQAEAVITQLGLIKCKDSIIGDHFLRGVSGGERKRVSIGQEMLINPSLIFLDEPTSGLDSTTAQRIVSTLLELANGGRTIVMTIHQPSSRIYYMFHKVLLLSEGNPLFFGKGVDAMNYFASIGFAPLVSMNPADFLLDLANGVSSDDSHDCQVAFVKQALILAFKDNLAEKLEVELRQTSMNQDVANDKQFARWPTTWWQQFSVLFKRGLKARFHDSFSPLKITQVLVVAFLCGLLWWQSGTSHLQDQIGLLYFYVGFWGFYPLFQAIFTFPQERKMLEKERSSGMYKLSSYFMALTVGYVPLELVLPTIFVIITYWMTGLKHSAGSFFATLFVLLYSILVAQGMGLAIGALVMDQKSATVLGSVIMLSFLLAGGYYVQHVPKFISWIKILSIGQHTYKLLLIAQYKPSDAYRCGNTTCLIGDFPSIKNVGLDGQVLSVVALGIMLVLYRLIAYLALMRLGVTRK